jgi:serine/threonine protein kinase
VLSQLGKEERLSDQSPLDRTQVDPSFGATLPISEAHTVGVSSAVVATATTTSTQISGGRTTVLPKVTTAPQGHASLVYEDAPRYAIERALGEGGVGEVVKALDNDIGRLVALKRLRPELRQAEPLARFVDEIRTVGKLEHPNIVPIHDVGVDEQGQHYFVMKYVHGETLESIIEKLAAGDADYHRRFPFEQRVTIFQRILDAVAFAHDAGYIHRDIKPANVMVGHFGEVMVMDWGIAKPVGKPDAPPPAAQSERSLKQTHVGALVGTPAYMSPEQARRQPDLDVRSDVYSLSLLFWELLTLQHPLANKTTLDAMLRGVIEEPVPFATYPAAASAHQPPVPADLAWFLRPGLEKDREKRYPDVRTMIERLERRREGDVPIQCPTTFAISSTSKWLRFVRRHPTLAGLGVVLSLLAIPTSIVLLLLRH